MSRCAVLLLSISAAPVGAIALASAPVAVPATAPQSTIAPPSRTGIDS